MRGRKSRNLSTGIYSNMAEYRRQKIKRLGHLRYIKLTIIFYIVFLQKHEIGGKFEIGNYKSGYLSIPFFFLFLQND